MKHSTTFLAQFCLASSAALFCVATLAQGTPAAEPRVALKGYDTVAYFTDNKPVKGAPEYRQDFDGLRYHFSRARNRSTFSADPDHFAPQFAANCAVSVSKGRRVEADPNVWKIVDGKLFVFASPKALEMAEKDPTILQRAQQDWAASK